MDIASLEKGHRFPPVAFVLDEAAVRGYLEAVEDAALPRCAGEGRPGRRRWPWPRWRCAA
jgi:hypothetical protein